MRKKTHHLLFRKEICQFHPDLLRLAHSASALVPHVHAPPPLLHLLLLHLLLLLLLLVDGHLLLQLHSPLEQLPYCAACAWLHCHHSAKVFMWTITV